MSGTLIIRKAIEARSLECVRLLLDAGADMIEAGDGDTNSLLTYAHRFLSR